MDVKMEQKNNEMKRVLYNKARISRLRSLFLWELYGKTKYNFPPSITFLVTCQREKSI